MQPIAGWGGGLLFSGGWGGGGCCSWWGGGGCCSWAGGGGGGRGLFFGGWGGGLFWGAGGLFSGGGGVLVVLCSGGGGGWFASSLFCYAWMSGVRPLLSRLLQATRAVSACSGHWFSGGGVLSSVLVGGRGVVVLCSQSGGVGLGQFRFLTHGCLECALCRAGFACSGHCKQPSARVLFDSLTQRCSQTTENTHAVFLSTDLWRAPSAVPASARRQSCWCHAQRSILSCMEKSRLCRLWLTSKSAKHPPNCFLRALLSWPPL